MAATSRLKMAELTSSLGAGILGVGIGILIASIAGGLVVPVLALGLALHLWGMFDKHRAERGTAQPGWSVATYWACWLALGGLVVYVAVRTL